MENQIINEFADWYINEVEGKTSNYFSNYFNSDKKRFITKLKEYGKVFEETYKFNPFEYDLSKEFILKIESILKNDIRGSFKEFNKKNQNGGPRALLGKRNYLRFLFEKIIDIELNKSKKNETFYLRKEFISWLVNENNFKLGSAKSYSSYVSSSNKLLQGDILKKDLFEIVKKYKDDSTTINDLIDACISAINKMSKSNVHKSKLKNGLFKYQEFLIDNIPPFEKTELRIETKGKLKGQGVKIVKSKTQVFEKNDLIEKFFLRIMSQERLYGDVFFPIKFLKKLFYYHNQKDFFDNWRRKQINNIKLHISNDEFLLLKKIDKLELKNSKVYVIYDSKNKETELLSEIIGSKQKEPIKRDLLKNIVIDHITPMKEILSKNTFEALPLITKKIKESKSFDINPIFATNFQENASNYPQMWVRGIW